MANARARAFLKQKGMEDRNTLLDQWETLQSENVEAQKGAGWGQLFGSTALPLAASFLIPGLPLWGAMLAAGIGSRAGSEIGEHWGGREGVRGAEGITPTGTQSMLRRDLQDTAEGAYGQFGDEQTMNAVQDAISMFSIGGGGIGPGQGPILEQLRKPSSTNLNTTLWNLFNPTENTSMNTEKIMPPLDYVPEKDYGDIYG